VTVDTGSSISPPQSAPSSVSSSSSSSATASSSQAPVAVSGGS
jgi:hypothetical protein